MSKAYAAMLAIEADWLAWSPTPVYSVRLYGRPFWLVYENDSPLYFKKCADARRYLRCGDKRGSVSFPAR